MSVGRSKWIDGIRGKVFLKDEFGGGNREKCNKICTRNNIFDKECSDKCLYQLIRSADGHTDDFKKCLVDNVEGKCRLKIVDVGCMTGSQDLPKTYAIPSYDPELYKKVLLESKEKDLLNCQISCERDYYFDRLGRFNCRKECNNRVPTDDQQCAEVMSTKKCVNECKSAMSTMCKLSQEHAAEMDTYDSISV